VKECLRICLRSKLQSHLASVTDRGVVFVRLALPDMLQRRKRLVANGA
jgi:hypothetical protein